MVLQELLEEEDKDAAAAAAVSQKKKQAKNAGKERRKQERRDAADGRDGSQKEEHAEEQKDTERTEARDVSDSEKNKTANVAAVTVAAAQAEEEEEMRRQEAAERQETRQKEEEERQKEETDFMRAWTEPIYLLENAKGGPLVLCVLDARDKGKQVRFQHDGAGCRGLFGGCGVTGAGAVHRLCCFITGEWCASGWYCIRRQAFASSSDATDASSEENVECRRVGVRTKPRWLRRGW
jgi:hypothetical protein